MRKVRCRDVALLITFVSCLLLGANYRVFIDPIPEEGDGAAHSLLIIQAKRGLLLHGNYSRVGFFHPGPAILWVQMAAEYVVYDTLALTPTPYNAQHLGSILFDAVMIGLAVGLAGIAWGRISPVPVLLPLWLGYLTWAGVLQDAWLANLYCPLYLALQMAAVAVAAGHHRALPALAVLGGVATHGHASFVVFVAALTGFAVASMVWVHRTRLREVWTQGRWSWIAALTAWAAFAAPIVAHTWLNYPGEIWRYVGYMRTNIRDAHEPGAVFLYIWEVQTNQSVFGTWLTLATIVAALAISVVYGLLDKKPVRSAAPAGAWPRVTWATWGVAAVSTICVFYYSARGVDTLDETYMIRFCRTVIMVAGLPVVYWLDGLGLARWSASRVGVVISGVACVGLAASGAWTWGCAAEGELQALADRLAVDPRWESRRLVITMDQAHWPQAAGLVVRLERRGRVACVLTLGGGLGFIFPERYHPDEAALAGDPWLLDFTGSTPPPEAVPARRVLAELVAPDGRQTVVSEVQAVTQLGRPVRYVGPERATDISPAPPRENPLVWAGAQAPEGSVTIPVRVEFGSPADGPVDVAFILMPVSGIMDPDLTSELAVFVNGKWAGRVSYPRSGSTVQRLPVPVPVTDLARPTLVTFQAIPPDSERHRLFPSGDQYHTVRIAGLKFERVRQTTPPK